MYSLAEDTALCLHTPESMEVTAELVSVLKDSLGAEREDVNKEEVLDTVAVLARRG